MLTFTFEPGIGPQPLKFGMAPAQVKDILGPADTVSISHFGTQSEYRKYINVGYSNTYQLERAVFVPGVTVMLFGHDLFAEPDLLSFLKRYDSKPFLSVGFVVFSDLGIRLSGFRIADEEDKAIEVAPRGHYDDFAVDADPFASA